MYNSREQKLRRKLAKLGYLLRKYKGGYMIVDSQINGVVAGGGEWFNNLTLEEAEGWLADELANE